MLPDVEIHDDFVTSDVFLVNFDSTDTERLWRQTNALL